MAMGKSAGVSALVIVALLISTPNIIAVYAQSVPVPSVPKFTLKLVAYPYDVAPTTTLDPYTGNNVTTEEGYRVENQSIQITITNQPYSYTFNGTNYKIFYNVRVKGHFEADNWKETYDYDYYYNTNYHYSNYPPTIRLQLHHTIGT